MWAGAAVGQVGRGHKNDLWFEVNGAAASLRWFQERQNELWIGRRHSANQIMLKDPSLVGPEARRYAQLPPRHQEAWRDAFRNVIADVYARIAGHAGPGSPPSFPTFGDGYRAACLVDAVLD